MRITPCPRLLRRRRPPPSAASTRTPSTRRQWYVTSLPCLIRIIVVRMNSLICGHFLFAHQHRPRRGTAVGVGYAVDAADDDELPVDDQGELDARALAALVSDEPEPVKLGKCAKLLDSLMKSVKAEPFNVPVDWQALNLLDYPRIVLKPMDLGTASFYIVIASNWTLLLHF